ncbi:MAG: sulfotransferase [Dongiaceae bacterium]
MNFANLTGKTFVLGVGAQKAGTTWLYEYLRRHGAFAMSPIKELHYFDQKLRPDLCAAFGGAFEAMLRNAQAGIEGASANDPAKLEELSHLVDRVRMNHDESAYFDYFDRLAAAGASHLGEITPSYSLIRADGFRRIRELFGEQGLALKIVFLMRDPIDRLLSQLAMEERENGRPADANAFRAALFSAHFTDRSRYDRTIESLLGAFDPADIHVGFYETLFDERAIAALCGFLCVETRPADFDRRVNAGDAAPVIGRSEHAMGLDCFREVYDFCRQRFGARVPANWGEFIDHAR